MALIGSPVRAAEVPVPVAEGPSVRKAGRAGAAPTLRLPDADTLHRRALQQGALSHGRNPGRGGRPSRIVAAVIVGVVCLVVMLKNALDHILEDIDFPAPVIGP
jgi:hypothetical protein